MTDYRRMAKHVAKRLGEDDPPMCHKCAEAYDMLYQIEIGKLVVVPADELERVRKDAARYQWLREHLGNLVISVRPSEFNYAFNEVTELYPEPKLCIALPESVDAAIDAAMESK